ncbi:shikimate dehydrogenase [Desulforhopalus singaporensis]|uniref:Shikimate dehydrogenase (NADP(+)) n=1 Tax=Desulforhopalus singaporensis TaxID=91360 RepID=A0A1H0LX99_9BACT|nr:shikimate dehydrogenase [Desulforhopalus singaporensis]SDO72734.1 shikimate dehydrogenase [Desulforhopalus singaporensis]
MNPPTVTTRLVALLGTPLGHSVSPPMHNRVYQMLGMDYCYLPIEVSEEDLGAVFTGLSKMNVAGCNVTIPHKVNVMKYLDELDPVAENIGAVNTICFTAGRAKGYNTDGLGFITSLEEESRTQVENRRFFVVGAGGAAKAICMTLAHRRAAKIYICNRTLEKAAALADRINSRVTNCSEPVLYSPTAQKKAIAESDVIINCTSLGMYPDVSSLPLDPSFITSRHVVADIVYNPRLTRLLKEAEKRGAGILPGLGMLVYQGAAAFKLFTGVDPLVDEMYAEASKMMDKK